VIATPDLIESLSRIGAGGRLRRPSRAVGWCCSRADARAPRVSHEVRPISPSSAAA